MLTFSEWLLEAIDLNDANNTGYTPLHLAVNANNPEMVEKLLNHGVNVHAKSAYGETALDMSLSIHRRAAQYKHVAYTGNKSNDFHIKYQKDHVLPKQEEIINILDNHIANHPLSEAISQDLLNAPDKDGWSPLHNAIIKENPSMVQKLLNIGANPHLKLPNTKTYAIHASRGNDMKPVMLYSPIELARERVKNGAENVEKYKNYYDPEFHRKFVAGHETDKQVLDVLEKHIAKHNLTEAIDINEPALERSPLHMAIMNRDHNIVKKLLIHGADIHQIVPGFSYTPLELSRTRVANSEYRMRDSYWNTDYIAVENHKTDKEILNTLEAHNQTHPLKEAIDINDADEEGYNALHKAIIAANPQMVEKLIGHGVDVKSKTVHGYSAHDINNRQTEIFKSALAVHTIEKPEHKELKKDFSNKLRNHLEISNILTKYGAE